MEFDYEKLFAEGNVVGLRNVEENKIYIHSVQPKEYWELVNEVNWSEYFNENLCDYPDDFEIDWITKLDKDGNFIEKVWERKTDDNPKPEPVNGMIIEVFNGEDEKNLGIVVDNVIIYQNGGYDYVNEVWYDDTDEFYYITKIWSNNCTGFNVKDSNLIWERKE